MTGLSPNTHYSYTIQMRDALGNVTAPSKSCEAATSESLFRVYADSFTTPRDFLTEGVRDTVWDGYLDSKEGSQAAAIVADAGRLRLQSQGTVWDGNTPRGPWLYRLVSGDFVVQVQVVDYAGLAVRRTPGNTDGGLMVRVPDLQAAGPGEDLVQLNFFPIWGQGNMVTNLDGARLQKGNRLAWEAHRHLQILRQGTLFHFRTSADGTHWSDMPGSPVERPDMAGIPLEVGVFHASYGGDSSYIAFSDFDSPVSRESDSTAWIGRESPRTLEPRGRGSGSIQAARSSICAWSNVIVAASTSSTVNSRRQRWCFSGQTRQPHGLQGRVR
jgi:hypothetical protein